VHPGLLSKGCYLLVKGPLLMIAEHVRNGIHVLAYRSRNVLLYSNILEHLLTSPDALLHPKSQSAIS
jgi:hypothetical protein